MADNGGGDRSIKTTPPSLSSPHALSISAQGVASEQKMAAGATSTLTREPEQQQDQQQQQQQQRENVKMGMSPASKGFYQRRGSADRHRVPENNFGGGPDGDEDDDTVVARGRTLLSRQDNDNCNGSEGRNGSQRRPGGRLRVQDQDGPLDFSVRRRESVSESFTDDSRASSSLSPTNFAGGTGSPSAHGSPEFDGLFPHHQQQQRRGSHSNQQFQMTMQQQGVATSVLDHGRARPSVSDESELVGQPRTVPLAATGGSPSPSSSSAGHLLSNGGSGKSASSSSPLSSSAAAAAAAAAALLSQNGAMLGPLNSLPGAFLMDPRRVTGVNGGKSQRPFKAYPKELLQMPLGYLGHPSLNPLVGFDPGMLQGLSLSQEELMAIYSQQIDIVKDRDKHTLTTASKTTTGSSPSSTSSNGSSSGTALPQHSKDPGPTGPPPPLLAPPPSLSLPSPQYTPNFLSSPSNSSSKTPSPTLIHSAAGPIPSGSGMGTASVASPFPPPTAPPLVSSTSSGSVGGGSRKRPRSLPDSQKDDAYWERRRKNNDAAKRSRDARRAKEDEIAIRAALLEQENLKLRVEVAALKSETARLRCFLYNSS